MKYLPDTNACIALLRRRDPALIARWRAIPVRDMALSAVVIYELRYGAERSTDPVTEHAKVDAFLRPFGVIAFDENCAARCGRLRRTLEREGCIIGPHDLMIAATALSHGLTLITHNTGEFRRVDGLAVEDWQNRSA